VPSIGYKDGDKKCFYKTFLLSSQLRRLSVDGRQNGKIFSPAVSLTSSRLHLLIKERADKDFWATPPVDQILDFTRKTALSGGALCRGETRFYRSVNKAFP